jgi:hypothetical protein
MACRTFLIRDRLRVDVHRGLDFGVSQELLLHVDVTGWMVGHSENWPACYTKSNPDARRFESGPRCQVQP